MLYNRRWKVDSNLSITSVFAVAHLQQTFCSIVRLKERITLSSFESTPIRGALALEYISTTPLHILTI